jgi:hypothetical protein
VGLTFVSTLDDVVDTRVGVGVAVVGVARVAVVKAAVLSVPLPLQLQVVVVPLVVLCRPPLLHWRQTLG